MVVEENVVRSEADAKRKPSTVRSTDDPRSLDDSMGPTVDASPTGYRLLATRISRWTTNLLLSAVIVLIAILLGNRLTELWRPAHVPTQPDPLAFEFLEDKSTPLRLVFGNGRQVITRQNIQGSRAAAQNQLVDLCAQLTSTTTLPRDEASESEVALLQRIKLTEPIRTTQSGAHIYRLGAAFPMVVGTRRIPAAEHNSSAANSELSHRVVTWGLAAPGLQQDWNVYVLGPQQGPVAAASTGEPIVDVPAPPGTDHLLSIGTIDGAAVMAFRGERGPAPWAEFYDEWFSDRDWKLAMPWRTGDRSWSGRYRITNQQGVQTADIQIRLSDTASETATSDQTWRGIVTHTISKPDN